MPKVSVVTLVISVIYDNVHLALTQTRAMVYLAEKVCTLTSQHQFLLLSQHHWCQKVSSFLSKHIQPPQLTCSDFPGYGTRQCILSSSALFTTKRVY